MESFVLLNKSTSQSENVRTVAISEDVKGDSVKDSLTTLAPKIKEHGHKFQLYCN